MNPHLKTLVRLQDLDNQINALKKEIASLPQRLQEIERQLDSHLRKFEASQVTLKANQKERRNLELEIEDLQQKLSRFKDQLMQARTNEQYWALQHEIEYVKQQISKREDRILELLLEAEQLEEEIKKADDVVRRERQLVEAEKQRASQQVEEAKKQLQELLKERASLAETLDPQLLKQYESIRTKRGGIAVAEVVNESCGVCHIALRPPVLQELRRGEQILCCESCGRILYFRSLIEEVVPDTEVQVTEEAHN